MKKVIALTLVTLMILSAFSSCDNEDVTTPTEVITFSHLTQSIISSTTTTTQPTSTTGTSTTSKSSQTTISNTTKGTIQFPTSVATTPQQSGNFDVNSVLTATQLKIYNQLLSAAKSFEKVIDLGNVDKFDIMYAYSAVNKYNPSVFWFPREFNIVNYSNGYNLKFYYDYTEEQVKGMAAKLQSAVADFQKKINAHSDDYSIALAVHDNLCEKLTYDHDFAANSYNIYGALVENKATCEGYSRAYQYLLSLYQIQSVLVSGQSNGNGHLWNKVCIGGSWYNADLTFDDSDDFVNHFFFNRTDAEFTQSHTQDRYIKNDAKSNIQNGMEFNLKLPSCIDSAANYYKKNNTMINNANEFDSVIASALLGEKSGTYEFGCGVSVGAFPQMNTTEYENFKEKIVQSVRKVTKKSFSIYGVPGAFGFSVNLN